MTDLERKARRLALLALQSDRYVTDPEYRQAVADVLAIVGQSEGR